MGNQQTNQIGEEFYHKLRFVKSLGASKSLMQNPNTQQFYITLQSTFPSESQAIQYFHELKKRIEPCHQYYLGPQKYFIITNNTFCSKQYKAIQIYPYEQYTLQQEIMSREEQDRYFNDKEIWSVLCSCVLAMANFTRNQILHLQLNPSDIILNAQGQIKVISHDISEYQIDYNYNKGFYYAPETLKCLRNKVPFTHSNKSGVFTLGISILHALLLENMSEIYTQEMTINANELNRRIMNVESDQMREILIKMLKIAPYERISFTELQEMLYSILEHHEREDDEELQKLEQSIYRINTQHTTNKIASLPIDEEDQPQRESLFLDCDIQQIDESEQQNDYYKTSSQQTQTQRAFTDKTSTYCNQINKKQQSCQKSKNIIETAEGTERNVPCYVNQQYSRGRYEGYKQYGMRHGFGTFHYEEGGRYSGEWKYNKMEGRGALYYSTGQIAYEGEWKNDRLHGYGVLYNENPIYITSQIDWKNLDKVAACWVKYQGNFEQDQRSGEGTLCLSNGQYYRGQFKADQPWGKGLFRRVSGQLIKGSWQSGTFLKYQN